MVLGLNKKPRKTIIIASQSNPSQGLFVLMNCFIGAFLDFTFPFVF